MSGMHVNREKVNLLVDSKTDSNVHSSENQVYV